MRIPHGPPAIIWTDPPNPRGATWGPDGDILIAGRGVQDNKGQLWLIPAAGGPARVLDFSDMKGGWFFEPEFLPQGGNFLFTWAGEGEDQAGLYLATLRRGSVVRGPVLLRHNVTAGHFSPSGGGRLLYVQDDDSAIREDAEPPTVASRRERPLRQPVHARSCGP